MDKSEQAQAYIAAYELADAEAATWSEVRDHHMWLAALTCQQQLGMSLRAAAKELGVPRSTLARTIRQEEDRATTNAGRTSRRVQELEDEIFIRVGLSAHASPDAQFAHGLISEYERDQLNDRRRRVGMAVPDQIREVVATYPGIEGIDLPKLLTLGEPVVRGMHDLHHHAGDAECAVDGAGRWWPTKNIADLQPGDRIPRMLGQFEREKTYEWVTVLSVTQDDPLDTRYTVEFQTKEGPSKWPDCAWDERQPVR
jgi:hypothetical protein